MLPHAPLYVSLVVIVCVKVRRVAFAFAIAIAFRLPFQWTHSTLFCAVLSFFRHWHQISLITQMLIAQARPVTAQAPALQGPNNNKDKRRLCGSRNRACNLSAFPKNCVNVKICACMTSHSGHSSPTPPPPHALHTSYSLCASYEV